MAFPYLGATTGLFTRLGHVAFALNSINSFIGNTNLAAAGIESIGSGADEIATSFTTPDINLIGGLYSARDAYRGVHTAMQTYLQSLAQSLVIQMTNENVPPGFLSSQTLPVAMAALIAQMKTDAQTVSRPTLSSSVTATAGNTGNGFGVSGVLAANGIQQDYAYNETITLTCSTDGQSGGTAGQETFTITSPSAETNPLQWDWPLGTALNTTQTAVDATVDNAGGNLLQNGSGKTWTNPTIGPDNWLISVGTVGTQIVQATGAAVYKGNSGFSFVGDVVTAPAAPTLGTVTGTSNAAAVFVVITYTTPSGETTASAQSTLTPTAAQQVQVTAPAASGTANGYNIYVGTGTGGPYFKQNASPIALGTNYTIPGTPTNTGPQPPASNTSGALTAIVQPFNATPSNAGNAGGTAATLTAQTQYALNLVLKVTSVPAGGVLAVDLTDGSGNITNDANGVPNSLSFALTGATTSFVSHPVLFRTPTVIPASGFRLRVRLTTALSGGSTLNFGHIALTAVPPIYAGGPAIAIFSGATNFIKGDSISVAVSNNYGSKWQFFADRVFGMRAMGLQFPSSATPTIADTVIS